MSDENTIEQAEETPKPSKLKKAATYTAVAGLYFIPVGLSVAYGVYGFRVLRTNHELAKLNLAAAKAALNK